MKQISCFCFLKVLTRVSTIEVIYIMYIENKEYSMHISVWNKIYIIRYFDADNESKTYPDLCKNKQMFQIFNNI